MRELRSGSRRAGPRRGGAGRAAATIAAVGLTVAALAGCFTAAGVGGGVFASGGSGGGSGSDSGATNGAPITALQSPPDVAGGDVRLRVFVQDPEGDPVDLAISVTLPGRGAMPFTEASGLRSAGTAGLAAPPAGVEHEIVWSSFADTGPANVVGARLRVEVRDAATGSPGNAVEADLDVLNAFVHSPIGVETLDPDSFALDTDVAAIRGPGGEARALVIADPQQQRVWRFDLMTGELAPLAGTGVPGFTGDNVPATEAALANPVGVAVDAAGNVFIADTSNGRIRRVDAITGFITTVAGGGAATGDELGDGGFALDAALDEPRRVAVDAAGNLYISDTGARRVRCVNRGPTPILVGGKTIEPQAIDSILDLSDEGLLEGLLGLIIQGPGDVGLTRAQLEGIAVQGAATSSASDLEVYVVDSFHRVVLRVTSAAESEVVLDAADLTTPELLAPVGIDLFESGGSTHLVITDIGASIVIAHAVDGPGTPAEDTVVLSGQARVSGFGGDGGPPAEATLNRPQGVCVVPFGGALCIAIADTGNQVVRAFAAPGFESTDIVMGGLAIPGGTIQTIAGALLNDPGAEVPALVAPAGVVVLDDGTAIVSDFTGGAVLKVDPMTRAIVPIATGLLAPAALALVPDGAGGPPRSVAVSEAEGHVVFEVPLDAPAPLTRAGLIAEGRVLAGTGVQSGGEDGDVLSDGQDNLGDGGLATAATLSNPVGLAIEDLGGGFRLYIADAGNHRVRVVDETGTIYTYVNAQTRNQSGNQVPAGGFTGDGARLTTRLTAPTGVAVDPAAGMLWIADAGNHLVRRVAIEDPTGAATALVTTVIGRVEGTNPGAPAAGFNGDNRPALGALLDEPVTVLVRAGGGLLISDRGNQRVRRVTPDTGGGRLIFTVTGTGLKGFNGDGAPAENTALNDPVGLFEHDGALYIGDAANLRLRRHKAP